MKKYIVKRILLGAGTILFSTTLLFIIMRMLPGSPVGRIVGYENYSNETAKYVIQKYGLDKPILLQLANYYKRTFSGDWGASYVSQRPVWELIIPKLSGTILLAIPSAVLAFVFGVSLALISERFSKKSNKFLLTFCNIASSIPAYIVAILLVFLLSYQLKLFPIAGIRTSRNNSEGVYAIMDVIWHSILPITSLVFIDTAYFFKVMKASIAEQRNAEYTRFLLINGVPLKRVVGRYVARNSIIPAINILSISLTRVVIGSLYIEIVFAWPGMGRLIYQAIMDRDYMVLSAGFFVVTVTIVFFMLIVDVIHIFLDPRLHKVIKDG